MEKQEPITRAEALYIIEAMKYYAEHRNNKGTMTHFESSQHKSAEKKLQKLV